MTPKKTLEPLPILK